MIAINDVPEKIKSYILNNTFSQIEDLQYDTLIFENSLLDSMGFIFLIDFLKEEFKIEIEDNELVNENFESINSISRFLIEKLKQKELSKENMI